MNKVGHSCLWIGNKADAADEEALTSNKILHVVNVARELIDKRIKRIAWNKIGLNDGSNPNGLYVRASSLVARLYLKDANTLVHCFKGKNRGPLVVILALLRATNKSPQAILDMVHSARPISRDMNKDFKPVIQYFIDNREKFKIG